MQVKKKNQFRKVWSFHFQNYSTYRRKRQKISPCIEFSMAATQTFKHAAWVEFKILPVLQCRISKQRALTHVSAFFMSMPVLSQLPDADMMVCNAACFSGYKAVTLWFHSTKNLAKQMELKQTFSGLTFQNTFSLRAMIKKRVFGSSVSLSMSKEVAQPCLQVQKSRTR